MDSATKAKTRVQAHKMLDDLLDQGLKDYPDDAEIHLLNVHLRLKDEHVNTRWDDWTQRHLNDHVDAKDDSSSDLRLVINVL